MEYIPIIVATLVSLVVGVVLGLTIIKKATEKKSNQILKDAEAEAEVVKKEKILQAKEKFLQLKSDHEKYINEKKWCYIKC
jgi:ribonucrease Y